MSLFVKKFFDGKTLLWLEENDKRARLTISVRDGNPRLTIYVNNAENPKKGIIPFPSDIPTFLYVLHKLKEIAQGERENYVLVDSLTTLWENDKPTKNKRLVSTLVIGKNSKGIVYISIIMEDRPKLVFEIKPTEWHVFKNKNKETMSEDEVSKVMATAMADFLLHYVSNVYLQYNIEINSDKETKDQQSGVSKTESNSNFLEEELGF